jgi:hypothetical protein
MAMKTTIFVFCFLCTTAALGQSFGGSLGTAAMSSTYQITGHQQQAAAHTMAQEQNLLSGTGGVYIEHGERPLWEVAPPDPPTIPLGDVARAYRKQHESAKKAQFVYAQVGSE